jgi:dihydrofolate synthase/folylpolyglutamate synthase
MDVMPRITTIEEANAALLPFVPLVAQLTGQDRSLDERVRPLMAKLGNPQNSTRVVHIAGTSGKTSTAYFIAALLRATGKRVGLTVSPHVDSVTERVQLDGKPLDEQRFCRYLGEFLEQVERMDLKPSYFELLYAFAFWIFRQEGVDYAVIETGLGGLYDATNVADRTDKLCVITDIGYDHMHLLGHTITEIAAQKIGIVHPGNDVIMYHQSAEVGGVVEAWVRKQAARLHATTQDAERQAYGADFEPELPAYQQRNWLLAYAAYRFLQTRDGLPQQPPQQLTAAQHVQVPARMDVRTVGDKTLVMDGAHNGQKMYTFLESFGRRYPGARPAVMIALKTGKEPADVAPLLMPFASRIIVTTFDTSQDLPAKSIDPAELADIFRRNGTTDVTAVADHHEAYERLLAGPERYCIITGSFYLLSQVRGEESLVTS